MGHFLTLHGTVRPERRDWLDDLIRLAEEIPGVDIDNDLLPDEWHMLVEDIAPGEAALSRLLSVEAIRELAIYHDGSVIFEGSDSFAGIDTAPLALLLRHVMRPGSWLIAMPDSDESGEVSTRIFGWLLRGPTHAPVKLTAALVTEDGTPLFDLCTSAPWMRA